MVRTIVLLVVGTLISVAPLSSQGPATLQLSGSLESEIVAAAEREVATFPLKAEPPRRMKKLFTSADTHGTGARRCVAGIGRGPVRSGEFVIGGELSGKDPRDTRKGVAPKIWWSPLHHGPKMELLVRGRHVGAGGEYRFLGTTVAHSSQGPNQQTPIEEREYFFPSGIEFLHSGKWVVVATQGSDWGCFILTLPSPVAG